MVILLKALAEAFGTFLFIFMGMSSILLFEKYPDLFPSFGVALTFSSVICVMILLLGNFSGAHFNPAVTLAFAMAKRLPISHIPFYWISQFLGGIAAVGLLIALKKI